MQYRHLLLILMLCLSVSNVHGGGYVKAKYAGEFMASGVDARALGMGGAFVAIADGVSASYWNPAGLATIGYPEVMGMYAEQFAKIVNYNYGAIAIPSGEKTSLGLGFIRLGVDDIPVTGLRNKDLEMGETYEENGTQYLNTPYVVKTINDAEWAFYLSYAKATSERFAWGINVKSVAKNIGDNSAWGLGFDAGIRYRLWASTYVAANFQDASTTMLAWDTGRKEAITPTLKIGAAHIAELSFLAGRLIPAVDIDIRAENRQFASQFNVGNFSFDSHIGLEYSFRNVIALRAGLPDIGEFSAGAGFRLPHLNIDYAFLNHDELGETHRISIRLTLEEARFARARFKK